MRKIIVALGAVASTGFGKQVFCKSRLTEESDHSDYCTRFSVGEDQTMDVRLETRVVLRKKKNDADKVSPGDATFMQAAIFDDQHWEELLKIGMDVATCEEKKELATVMIDLIVPLDGTSAGYVDGKNQDGFTQFQPTVSRDRPHMYYFKILDCNQQMRKQFGDDMPRVETKWHIRSKESWNYDDDKWTEFGYEDSAQYSMYFWLWIMLVIVTVSVGQAYYKYYIQFEKLCTPHPFILASLATCTISLWFELMHCWWYASDGQGVLAFDVFAKIFVCVSEVILCILLLMLASGWTTIYEEIDFDDSLDIYLPIGAVVVVLHIMLAALDYVDVDESHKYHDYAGLQGYFLIAIKLILLIGFLVRIRFTWQSVEIRTRPYFLLLARLGAVYLGAIPLAIFCAWTVRPYNRQFAFTCVSWLISVASQLTLYWQLARKDSVYAKGNMDALGLLPMGGMPSKRV